MCTSPLRINGQFQGDFKMAQCRKCDECIAARKRHWIGRMLAEEQTSVKTWFATFTYAGGYGNEKAYWLQYSDLQKTIKRMRRAGHRFKYVAVGEYGTKLSRAHWHVIFYWKSEPPVVEMDKRIQWKYWEMGATQIEFPRSQQGAAVYLMDYLNKTNLRKNVMKYSKNPALGQEYLLERARHHARTGVALFANGDNFTVPGNTAKTGKPFYYPVGRDTAIYEKMLKAYVETWVSCRPKQRIKLSPDVTDYLGEITQDPNEQTPAVQKYLADNYGYHCATEETIFTLHENCHIRKDPFRSVICITYEGKITWADEIETEPDADHRNLRHSEVRQACRQIKNGPKRLQKFVHPHQVLRSYLRSCARDVPIETRPQMHPRSQLRALGSLAEKPSQQHKAIA